MAASRLPEVVDNIHLFIVALINKDNKLGTGSELGYGHHKGAEIRSSLHIPYGGY